MKQEEQLRYIKNDLDAIKSSQRASDEARVTGVITIKKRLRKLEEGLQGIRGDTINALKSLGAIHKELYFLQHISSVPDQKQPPSSPSHNYLTLEELIAARESEDIIVRCPSCQRAQSMIYRCESCHSPLSKKKPRGKFKSEESPKGNSISAYSKGYIPPQILEATQAREILELAKAITQTTKFSVSDVISFVISQAFIGHGYAAIKRRIKEAFGVIPPGEPPAVLEE